MIIGGKTQYITTAQGMPEHYVDLLMKRIRSFLWNTEAIPPVATELLSEPLSQGGRKILDLRARNDAINIIKIKKLLDHSVNRLASDVTTAIIVKTLRKSITKRLPSENMIQDIFLQSIYYWNHYMCKSIPSDIRNLLNTAMKFTLTLHAPTFSSK